MAKVFKEETIKLIDSFMKENLVIEKNYNKALKALEQLCEFLVQNKISPSIDELITIIKNNSILLELIKIVAEQNIAVIKKGNIDTIFDNEILISLIEAYCIINDILIEIDDELEEISYETRSAFSMYMTEIHQDKKLLSREEEKELAKRIKEGDEEARNIFIERNLRVVPLIAKRYLGRGLDIEDLVQEGNLGLFEAVERFDYKKGYKFSTYAILWIKQKIDRAVKNKGRNIRLPVHVNDTIHKINTAIKKLNEKLQREPSLEEISGETGIEITKLKQYLEIQNTISLNTLIGDNDNSELEDFVPDVSEGIENIVINKTLVEKLRIIINLLKIKERDKKIFIMRYGLDGEKTKTLEEIGSIYGITRERVRQVEEKILREIRKIPQTKGLAEYTDDPEQSLINLEEYNSHYYDSTNKKNRITSNKSLSIPEIIPSIYEILNEYTKEEINFIIYKLLTDEEKSLLKKRYGDDLENPVCNDNWTEEDHKALYKVLLWKIKKILNNNRRLKSIYEYLNDYIKEEIDFGISLLSDEEKDILKRYYGEDFKNIIDVTQLPINDYIIIYELIVVKLKKVLKTRLKKSQKIKTIYELLSEYTKEEINYVIYNLLNEEERSFLKKCYGDDLEHPSHNEEWNKNDYYNILLRKIKRLLKENRKKIKVENKKKEGRKMAQKLKSIYELLKDYTKEEIDYVIYNLLTDNERLLLAKRYGKDLDNPVSSPDWNNDDNNKFYGTLLQRIKRLLKKEREKKNATKSIGSIPPRFPNLDICLNLLKNWKHQPELLLIKLPNLLF